MENPNKIEIVGLKTIHKLCKFGADHNMQGCSFAEIVECMFVELGKAQLVPAWIPIGDRLPEFEQEVLLFSDNQIITAQYLPSAVNEFNIHFDEGFWINGGASIELNATHWQSLPEPPKAQEQGHETSF